VTPTPPSSDEERVGLSTNAAGHAVPSAWTRARGRVRLEDPFIGWTASIAVALLALFLRLWKLGKPHVFEFDETYYAKDAWSLVHFGYVREYTAKANEHILDGQVTGEWKDDPSMIVHPEVGKWLIGLGEKAFGMDPFGWRVAAAVAGALMVLVMCRFARRLTGSTALGIVAGLLLAFDGLQFVLSRLALLDIFVALFLLCGVHCVVADRDWHRAKLARLVPAPIEDSRDWGPVRRLWFRPWLLAGGVSWGLAIGTKWEAAYPLAAFGLLAWLWSAGARRSFGVRWSLLRSAVADGIPAFVHLVLVAFVVYVVSWTGWLVHADQYEEHRSATQYTRYSGEGHCEGESFVADNPDDDARWPTATEPDASGVGEVLQSLRSLWY
jgi:dolichyl-phosphate-mannose-protein mannosyltransferase